VTAVFSKQSRYRLVPDVTVPDARGRLVLAKDVRLLPDVTGTFRHTVVANDRLDQLAFTYYGQPLQFWRICDANPDVLSPLALLGQEAVVTTRFPVTPPPGDPPWSTLLRVLAGTVGVDAVTVAEEEAVTPQRRTVTRTVLITYNRFNTDAGGLAELIVSAGFTVDEPRDVGRLGQSIVIPVAPG
jgi:hypothetical protein